MFHPTETMTSSRPSCKTPGQKLAPDWLPPLCRTRNAHSHWPKTMRTEIKPSPTWFELTTHNTSKNGTRSAKEKHPAMTSNDWINKYSNQSPVGSSVSSEYLIFYSLIGGRRGGCLSRELTSPFNFSRHSTWPLEHIFRLRRTFSSVSICQSPWRMHRASFESKRIFMAAL